MSAIKRRGIGISSDRIWKTTLTKVEMRGQSEERRACWLIAEEASLKGDRRNRRYRVALEIRDAIGARGPMARMVCGVREATLAKAEMCARYAEQQAWWLVAHRARLQGDGRHCRFRVARQIRAAIVRRGRR